MKGPVARLAALAVALAVVALARAPHPDLAWAVVSLGGSLVVLGLASAMAFLPTRAPRGLGPAVLAGTLATLLVPTSDQALLAAAPDWLVAGLAVAALHFFFKDPATKAPTISGTKASPPWSRRTLQSLPFAAAAAALLLAPLALHWLLPPRIHAAYELQGAAEPLAPLIILAVVFLVASRIGTRASRKPTGAPAPPDLGAEEAVH